MVEVRDCREQVADRAAVVVVIPVQRQGLVRRDKDLPEEIRARMAARTVAQAAAVRAPLVQTETQAARLAARVLPTSAQPMQAAAAVVLQVLRLQQAEQAAAVRGEDQPQQPEQQVQQIQAAAVVGREFQQSQEPLLAAQVVAALLLCAIPARQLAPLLAQQTRQHNPAVSPSILSLWMERW
jgi:hypothetical protein